MADLKAWSHGVRKGNNGGRDTKNASRWLNVVLTKIALLCWTPSVFVIFALIIKECIEECTCFSVYRLLIFSKFWLSYLVAMATLT